MSLRIKGLGQSASLCIIVSSGACQGVAESVDTAHGDVTRVEETVRQTRNLGDRISGLLGDLTGNTQSDVPDPIPPKTTPSGAPVGSNGASPTEVVLSASHAPRGASLRGSAAIHTEAMLVGEIFQSFGIRIDGKPAAVSDYFVTDSGAVGAAAKVGDVQFVYDDNQLMQVPESAAPSGTKPGSMSIRQFPGEVMYRHWHEPGKGGHSEVGRYTNGRFERILGKGDRIPFASNEMVLETGVADAHESGFAVITYKSRRLGTRIETTRAGVILPSGELVWGPVLDDALGAWSSSAAYPTFTLSNQGVLFSRGVDAPFIVHGDGSMSVFTDLEKVRAIRGSLQHAEAFAARGSEYSKTSLVYELDGQAMDYPDPVDAKVFRFDSAVVTEAMTLLISGQEDVPDESRAMKRNYRVQPTRTSQGVYVGEREEPLRRIALEAEVGSAASPDGSLVFSARDLEVRHLGSRGVLLVGRVAEAKLQPVYHGTGFFALAGEQIVPIILPGMKCDISGIGEVMITHIDQRATSPDGGWALVTASYESRSATGGKERGAALLRLRLPLPVGAE